MNDPTETKLKPAKCAGYQMLEDKARLRKVRMPLVRSCLPNKLQKDEDGKYYCPMHSRMETKTSFQETIEKKLKNRDYNFSGYWFPEFYDFGNHTFHSVADFRMTTFNEGASFRKTTFAQGANFRDARFKGKTDFYEVIFGVGEANFTNVRFASSPLSFSGAYFQCDVIFERVQFSGPTYFNHVTFAHEALFLTAEFKKEVFFSTSRFERDAVVSFDSARFGDSVHFTGLNIADKAELYFGGTIFEQPELVLFKSPPDFKPRWFIDADTRKFNFETSDFSDTSVSEELKNTEILLEKTGKKPDKKKHGEPSRPLHRLTTGAYQFLKANAEDTLRSHNILATVFRRLAVNAEENNRYEEAMKFRYKAMECRRLASLRFQLPPILHWLYWGSSGYGEKVFRAAVWMVFIWLVPLFFYMTPYAVFTNQTRPAQTATQTKTEISETEALKSPSEYSEATISSLPLQIAAFYSFNVMTYQKPEPKPADENLPTRLMVSVQTILGPVQAALLFLAIRRKFMR